MGSVNFEVNADPVEVIEKTENAVGRVHYSANYASYINYPTEYTGNSQPPFDPIHEWVQRKWQDLSDDMIQAAVSNSSASKAEKQEQVAWMVVNSLQEGGTEGMYFAERSIQFAKQKAEKIAKKYENSNDEMAPYKAVVDITDLMFQYSQQIISGDRQVSAADQPESSFDTGFLMRSGIREYSVDGDLEEKQENVKGDM